MSSVVMLLIGGAARANEESQAMSARALIAINAGKYDEALELLDRGVTADPDDAEVRYQRGVVRARLKDTNGAIEDLERALALRPYFPNAALELGVALVDADRAADAEAPLMQAQQVPALDAQASFYLALAQLRLGRFEMARTNFERARERDPSLATATQYYEGVIAFRRRDYDTAEQQFAAVQRDNPDTQMGRESMQYLEVIDDERASDYSAWGTMAFEYDSNVTLQAAQISDSTSLPRPGDWRFVVNGGGRWTPLRWGGASLSVGYEFYQSAQFQLSDYDLTDNRPAMQLQYDFDWVSIGLLGRYDYYLLGGESYLSEATGMPWVTIREEGFGRTELYARVQARDFKAAHCPPPPGDGDDPAGSSCYAALNGIYSFAGVRQFFDLGNAARQLWIGYQLGFTSPQPSENPQQNFNRAQYEYGAWAFEGGFRTPLPFDVLGELAYRYEYQSYNPASGCFQNGDEPQTTACSNLANYPQGFNPTGLTPRGDNNHRVIFSLERPLPEVWEHLSVVASYFGTFNDSNKDIFTYDRNIGSLAVQVRY